MFDFNFLKGRWLAVLALFLTATLVHADAYQEFFEAVRKDNPSVVRTWMLRGIDSNSSDPKDGPALVVAAATKSYQAMRALLESPETKVNNANKRGETALMMAALNGDLDAVKFLVSKGAEINKSGWTPLHYAASGGHIEIVKFLLDKHAYIDAASPNQTTPLMMATRHEHLTVVRHLIEEGADPSLRNDQGWTAADYFQRLNDPANAQWMRERARAYQAKYGTKQAPVRAPEPAQK